MKLLKKHQKKWLLKKSIKIGSFYMFPRFGFTIYSEAKFTPHVIINSNPFSKSLDHEYFLVKDEKSGFYKGNFYRKPLKKDFYIHKSELEKRDFLEYIILLITCYFLFIAYNFIKSK